VNGADPAFDLIAVRAPEVEIEPLPPMAGVTRRPDIDAEGEKLSDSAYVLDMDQEVEARTNDQLEVVATVTANANLSHNV
jgi:hypothetical protein